MAQPFISPIFLQSHPSLAVGSPFNVQRPHSRSLQLTARAVALSAERGTACIERPRLQRLQQRLSSAAGPEREREKERERQRERERQTERQRQRETETERQRETERNRERQRKRQTDRQR